MGMFTNKTGAKYTEVSAIITRADGTVEDLGVISKMKKESKIKSFFRRIFKWQM
jgi:hypothetical protein